MFAKSKSGLLIFISYDMAWILLSKKIIFKPWNVISGASSQLSQCFCRQLLLANPWLTCCSLYQKFPWNDIGSSGFHVCSRINAVFTGETQKPKTKTTMLEAVNLKKATPEQVEPLENPISHMSHPFCSLGKCKGALVGIVGTHFDVNTMK